MRHRVDSAGQAIRQHPRSAFQGSRKYQWRHDDHYCREHESQKKSVIHRKENAKRELSGYWIISASAEWMASPDTTKCQPATPPCAVALKGLDGIHGTTRKIAAGRWQHVAQRHLITPDHQHEKHPHHTHPAFTWNSCGRPMREASGKRFQNRENLVCQGREGCIVGFWANSQHDVGKNTCRQKVNSNELSQPALYSVSRNCRVFETRDDQTDSAYHRCSFWRKREGESCCPNLEMPGSDAFPPSRNAL